MAKLNKLYTRKEIDRIRNELISTYGNKCSICQKSRDKFKNSLAVDHNHKTGQIRGLLCFYCNKRVVGRHDLASATKVLNYLQKYENNQACYAEKTKKENAKRKTRKSS